MRLVELTYFPGEGHHRSSLLVNPDHVACVIRADSGRDGQQCWLRLATAAYTQTGINDFLVQGSLKEIRDVINGAQS